MKQTTNILFAGPLRSKAWVERNIE